MTFAPNLSSIRPKLGPDQKMFKSNLRLISLSRILDLLWTQIAYDVMLTWQLVIPSWLLLFILNFTHFLQCRTLGLQTKEVTRGVENTPSLPRLTVSSETKILIELNWLWRFSQVWIKNENWMQNSVKWDMGSRIFCFNDNKALFKYNRPFVSKFLEKLIESKTKEKGISLLFLNNTSLSKYVFQSPSLKRKILDPGSHFRLVCIYCNCWHTISPYRSGSKPLWGSFVETIVSFTIINRSFFGMLCYTANHWIHKIASHLSNQFIKSDLRWNHKANLCAISVSKTDVHTWCLTFLVFLEVLDK